MSLEELAKRVEALSAPDRATDGLIWAHLRGDQPFIVGNNPGRFPQEPIYGKAADVMRALPNKDGADYIGAPAYTASIDLAMTLVPDGWDCAAGTKADHGWAYLHNRQSHFVGIGTRRNPNLRWYETKGPTPAIALTAAALRAMVAKAVEEGGD